MSSSEEHKEEESEAEEPQLMEEYPEARQADNWNKDVNETGRWGTRSKREVLLVGGTILIAIMAVTLGIVFGVVLNEPETESAGNGVDTGATKIVDGQRVSAYVMPSPPTPTFINNPQEELDFLRSELARESAMDTYLELIATDYASLEGMHANPLASPYVRAASWLVTVDTNNVKEEAVTRFALAVIYYQNGGESWTNSENWLASDKRHCDWYGVECCAGPMQASLMCTPSDFYDIIELDLYRNNLSGNIPESIVLLKRLVSLFMSENKLSGTIPGHVFGELRNFTKLYLQHNKLIGTIPDDIDKHNFLGTFG